MSETLLALTPGQPHPTASDLWVAVGSGHAAKDDGALPAQPARRDQTRPSPAWTTACRPDDEHGLPAPISGGLGPCTAGSTPPRRLRSTRRPGRLAAQPGAGVELDPSSRQKPSRQRACRRSPFHAAGFRGINAAGEPPRRAFELEHYPRHDEAQIEHLACRLGTATAFIHALVEHRVAGAGRGKAVVACGRGRRSSWPGQRGCQELLEALKHEPVLEAGMWMAAAALDRRQHRPFKHSSETGAGAAAVAQSSVPACQPLVSAGTPAAGRALQRTIFARRLACLHDA